MTGLSICFACILVPLYYMRVYMKRNKNRLLTKILLVMVLLAGVLSFGLTPTASAAPVGCYVETQVGVTAANCPAEDSAGQPIDPAKCYVAPGGSSGTGSYSVRGCDSITVGSKTDGSSSSSERPGSTSNECLQLTEEEKAALKSGDPCYSLKTTQEYAEGQNDQCGKGKNKVYLSVSVGCLGEEYPTEEFNPIIDMAFAFFRFLSAGVGIIVIGSIILAGIQYSASRGNPQATEAAIKRVTNSVLALILYVFIFAIANFIVPGGMFI